MSRPTGKSKSFALTGPTLLLYLLRRGSTQRGELERAVVTLLGAAPITVRKAFGNLRQDNFVKGGSRRTGRPPAGQSPWATPVELTQKGKEMAERLAGVVRGLI